MLSFEDLPASSNLQQVFYPFILPRTGKHILMVKKFACSQNIWMNEPEEQDNRQTRKF
nr:hypothetical protein MarFTME_273 [Marseillevirus futianmevirus]